MISHFELTVAADGHLRFVHGPLTVDLGKVDDEDRELLARRLHALAADFGPCHLQNVLTRVRGELAVYAGVAEFDAIRRLVD